MIKNLQSAIINQQPTIDSQKSMINSQESTIRNNVEDVDAGLDEPLEDVSVTGDVLALAIFFPSFDWGGRQQKKYRKNRKNPRHPEDWKWMTFLSNTDKEKDTNFPISKAFPAFGPPLPVLAYIDERTKRLRQTPVETPSLASLFESRETQLIELWLFEQCSSSFSQSSLKRWFWTLSFSFYIVPTQI